MQPLKRMNLYESTVEYKSPTNEKNNPPPIKERKETMRKKVMLNNKKFPFLERKKD